MSEISSNLVEAEILKGDPFAGEPDDLELITEVSLPGKARQIKNFAEAALELRKKNIGQVQQLALTGLMTLIPEEVRDTGILESPERLQLIDQLLEYLMALNDQIDLAKVVEGDAEIANLTNQAISGAQEGLSQAIDRLPPHQAEQLRNFLEQGLREIQFYEANTNDQLDIAQVEQYRNTINAINECLINACIFGPQHFEEKSANSLSPTSLEDIDAKYAWLKKGKIAHKKLDQALIITHQMAMATQIIDDWRGRVIDSALGIPSFASAARHQTKNDNDARKLLWKQKDIYRQNAQQLGLGNIPARGSLAAFGGLMRFQRLAIRKAQEHPNLSPSQKLLKRLKLREKLRVKGQI
jgi:hypothetical protein